MSDLKPSDSLAKDVAMAKRAGMSYGQWKATQPVKEIPKKVQDGRCAWCGGMMKDGAKNKRYCSPECRSNAGYHGRKMLPAYSIEYGEEETERKCAWCGKTFPVLNKRKRYCSNKCSALATYYRRKEARDEA